MENNSDKTKNNHTCPLGHCCECNGCGNMCTHGGMRKYWRRHFIVLIVSVILAFWVGMKLGELKGFVMASLGYMPMHHERWSEPQPVNPTGAMPIQGAVYQPSTTPTGR